MSPKIIPRVMISPARDNCCGKCEVFGVLMLHRKTYRMSSNRCLVMLWFGKSLGSVVMTAGAVNVPVLEFSRFGVANHFDQAREIEVDTRHRVVKV